MVEPVKNTVKSNEVEAKQAAQTAQAAKVAQAPVTPAGTVVRPISHKGARLIAQAELLASGKGYLKVIPEHVRTMPDGTIRTVAAHSFVAKITEKTIKAQAPKVIKTEDPRVTAAKKLLAEAAAKGTRIA